MSRGTARAARGSLVGVDTGGTFTDLVQVERGRIRVHKVASTPDDPARAILAGIAELDDATRVREVVHGTTVATNAVLEGKLATTALVTNAGFEDVIEIGRQARPRLYDAFVTRPAPLVPRKLRFGIRGRIGPHGERVEPLDTRALRALVRELRGLEVRAIAVCFLHSYANPEDERRAGEILARSGLPVSLSSEVRPEFREYERTTTTALNAALVPVLGGYLERLEEALAERRLSIMHSGGGVISPERARKRPVETVLSGPAGGVAAAARIRDATGHERIVSFDMGGTSTDVALLHGAPAIAPMTEIAGIPVRIPVLDMHTVGAGGGSIARIDAGGALTVGPESAGADPGPIAYGRGGIEVTVTDADLFLGRIHADSFLGGRMQLDGANTRAGVLALAKRAGLDAARLAEGVLRVAVSSMARAVRRVSVQRGHDPADFTLMAFGGAGPLHAVELARELGMLRVLVPPGPGIFSAFGMAFADVTQDGTRTVMLRGADATHAALIALAEPLEARARETLEREGFRGRRLRIERHVSVRYVGQSHEIEVPLDRRFENRFHDAHRKLHDHAHPSNPIEVVTVRVRGRGLVRRPAITTIEEGGRSARAARIGTSAGLGTSDAEAMPVYAREQLRARNRIDGPAVIAEETATTYLPPGSRATVDAIGNLEIEVTR